MAEISSSQTDSGSSAKAPSALGEIWNRMRAFFGGRDADASLRESLEGIIEEHENGNEQLRDEERSMLINILNFGELRVDDVMVPRADIQAVEEQTSLEDLLEALSVAAHSRLPVFRDTLDDPVGMVHIKDVVGLLNIKKKDEEEVPSNSDAFPISKLRREVLFVPPSMPVADLFLKMQATHIHMALVIDEYGGTDGLVTIEDLVEEIVGEIEDEHDKDTSPQVTKRPDGSYNADARVEIEDLEELFDLTFFDDGEDDDVETLGGLVFSLVGRVPQRGELVPHPKGLDFEVVEADARRVKRVRIYINQQDGEELDAASEEADAEEQS